MRHCSTVETVVSDPERAGLSTVEIRQATGSATRDPDCTLPGAEGLDVGDVDVDVDEPCEVGGTEVVGVPPAVDEADNELVYVTINETWEQPVGSCPSKMDSISEL